MQALRNFESDAVAHTAKFARDVDPGPRFHCGDVLFFFSSRRRHTRCSRDWSSDVCSSDLRVAAQERAARLDARVASLTAELEAAGPHAPVGSSKQWRDVLGQAAKVAGAETTVLLTGESGTGKEGVAHLNPPGAPRAGGAVAAVDLAALPEAVVESELFGYEKGAF